MHVELLYHTPDPERAIATAARLCYAPVGAAELMETMPEERVRTRTSWCGTVLPASTSRASAM